MSAGCDSAGFEAPGSTCTTEQTRRFACTFPPTRCASLAKQQCPAKRTNEAWVNGRAGQEACQRVHACFEEVSASSEHVACGESMRTNVL
eukprot:954453-Pleurochrysis_carterae.AAC.1